MSDLQFEVAGIPAPQGSKRAFVVNGRARLVESAAVPVKAWRTAVADAALAARAANGNLHFEGPVSVIADFRFPRPKSARKAQVWKVTAPDLDKLARSTLDALTDAGVWRDDAQVCCLMAYKWLCGEGEHPGAHISIGESADYMLPLLRAAT